MEEQEKYARARKRVEEIKGFYTHLVVYILVNLALFVINLVTGEGQYWFFLPLIGWGIGIVAHAVSVFGQAWFWGADWEERKIKEIMDKDRQA